MTALKVNNTPYINWALGDPETDVTVGISTDIVCGAIDLAQIDLNNATLILIRNSGTGALKVSGQLSHDGQNDFYDLGDLITAVTTASKAFELSNASMVYGRYLTLTVTETGGAASATGKCYLMSRG
jgi:hypothetical protein